MSCNVCFESKSRLLTCSKCQTQCCAGCQLSFGKPACVMCANAFLESTLRIQGFQDLVKTLLKPFEANVFWKRELALMPATQTLLDWQMQVDELAKQLRFGFKVQFPPKPFLSLSHTGQTFACPSVECRGFVLGRECGACKREVCERCRELASASHECKSETLETLRLLQQDSKQCPKCKVSIFRTQGCDHMFCTFCRTHFDWISGKILSSSSNHHYDNSPIFAKLRHSQFSQQRRESCENPLRDAVHASQSNSTSQAFELLWKEPSVVRVFVKTRLDMEKLVQAHEAALLKIRMQFLQKKLDEESCKQKVWHLEKAFELKLTERTLLCEFLNVVNDLQMELVETETFNVSKLCVAADFFTSHLQLSQSKIRLQAKLHNPMLLL